MRALLDRFINWRRERRAERIANVILLNMDEREQELNDDAKVKCHVCSEVASTTLAIDRETGFAVHVCPKCGEAEAD